VRHRHDVVGRRLLQLIDKIDDARQLGDDVVEFTLVQLQTRERSDVLNLFSA
jgi:hypothetical protein